LGVAVIFLAPALVWAVVVGGLVRIVRERAQEGRPAEIEAQVVEADQSAASR
jgi:hypothetical protein